MNHGVANFGEQLRVDFQRTAFAVIDGGVAELENESIDEHGRVHLLRKRCKRLRSLFRLVRTGFADYLPENATVQSVARRLSAVRDAHACLGSFAAFLPRAERTLSSTEIRLVHETLVGRRDAVARELGLSKVLSQARATFIEMGGRVETWHLDSAVLDCARAGVITSYQRAGSRFTAISEDSSAERVHDWRKSTKDYRLQREFLLHESQSTHQLGSLDFINRKLGEHHDLYILTQSLSTVEVTRGLDVRKFVHEIEQHQTMLLRTALVHGRRMFAEPDITF